MEKAYSWAINLQEKVSSEIITYDTLRIMENICGIDVSYKNDEAYCSVRQDHFIEYDKIILGYEIKKEGKKPVYVSVGHKISLKKAIQIVQKIIKEKERLPEPLRIADINSKNYLNFT